MISKWLGDFSLTQHYYSPFFMTEFFLQELVNCKRRIDTIRSEEAIVER